MNYFELNGKPSRMEQTKEKKQHAEWKKPLRHETQMPQNPSENQRAGLKNHEQAFSSKMQVILSQCVSHQSKVVPCDLQHKPSKPKNTALEVGKHREKCKKIVYDILVDIGRKESLKLKQWENNQLRTAEDKELARKFKEKQMKKKAVAKKPLDDTSACKIGSKKQREMEIYWTEEQETQTLITDNEFELDQDLEKPNNHLLTTLSKHSNQNWVSSITQRETCQPVSEGRKGVKSILGILQNEYKKTLPEKDRFRNKCKQIAYDILTDIKKKEAADKALMEETLVKNMAKQEIALKLRDKMDKEKQAVTKKFLIDSWDAQIQHKQQKKREMAEIERKERQDVIESERLYQIEQNEKRRYKSLNLCEANSNEGDKQLKKAVSPQKQQKINTQDEFHFEHNTDVQILMQRETCQPVSEGRKGVQSISAFLQNERKNTLPEKVRFRKKCNQIVYDQMTDMKRKEDADEDLMEETLVKNMAKQEIALKLRDKMDKEKQAVTKTFLINTWDAQIQHNQQKKREMAEIERKERQDVIESARLYQIEQNEKRRYKSPNLCEANSNPVSVKDEGDKQLKKAVSPQKQQKINTQDEFHFEHNTDVQILMQRETCQPVSEGRKGVPSISAFLQNENKNTLPEKVRFRKKCNQIVYDQMTEMKRKEDADKALMEETLVKNMAKQEIALKLRDKMDKEKQAVTKKSLINTWDAQIQHKQQKKREMAEIERKERQDVIESARLYEIEKEKNIQLKRKKQAAYCEAQAALLDARPRRINNMSIIGMNGAFPPLPPICSSAKSNKDFKSVAPLDKVNTDHNSSLNSQQVNKPVKLPPLKPNPVPSAPQRGTVQPINKSVAPLPKLNTDQSPLLNHHPVVKNKHVKLPPLNPKPVPSAPRKGTINKQP